MLAQNSQTNLHYRPDLDGLRAIAVLAVVGYHAAPLRIHGGYVGVDIFFVISGFLITGIIARGFLLDTFSFLEFYARRVRRIFPALSIVMLVTLALGWACLLPDEFEQLGRHIVAGSLFSSNLLLWSEAGYFEANAEFKPLLHLWSLGIEEQFYLVWPLTLFVFLKYLKRPVWAIGAVAGISFILNIVLLEQSTTATFFSPFTRIWELLIGAVVATAFTERPDQYNGSAGLPAGSPADSRLSLNIASIAGIGLIGGSIVLFSRETPFPGWCALYPTIGTALLIVAGPSSWFNRVVLSNRYIVYVGLISYPFYLWHWPLLSYSNIVVLDDVSNLKELKVAALGIALIAAALTYRLIERPLRIANIRVVVNWLGGVFLVLILIGGIVMVSNGMTGRFSAGQLALINSAKDEKLAAPVEYRQGICFLSVAQRFSDLAAECLGSANSGVVLWGDSYSAHLYPGLKKLMHASKMQLGQVTMAACPPVLEYRSNTVPNCRAFNLKIALDIQKFRPQTIILAADWMSYIHNVPNFLPQLRDTFARLSAEKQKILLVGPPVAWYGAQVKIALRAMEADSDSNASLYQLRDVDDTLRSYANEFGIQYVSPIEKLCLEGRCRVFLTVDGRRNLIAWDWGHLTRDGSYFYAKDLIDPFLGLQVLAPGFVRQ